MQRVKEPCAVKGQGLNHTTGDNSQVKDLLIHQGITLEASDADLGTIARSNAIHIDQGIAGLETSHGKPENFVAIDALPGGRVAIVTICDTDALTLI